MTLEDIMLSEISQSQNRYCMIPHMGGTFYIWEVKFIDSKGGMVVARGWGKGKWEVTDQHA